MEINLSIPVQKGTIQDFILMQSVQDISPCSVKIRFNIIFTLHAAFQLIFLLHYSNRNCKSICNIPTGVTCFSYFNPPSVYHPDVVFSKYEIKSRCL